MTLFLRTAALLVIASLVLLAGGCSNNHDEWVADGTNRWHDMRSAMMLEMAHSQFASGQLDEADRTVREASEIDADNPQLYLLGGRIAFERGQLERSFRLFEAATEYGEHLPDPHYYRGVVLQRWQQYDRALEAYERALELQPDNPGNLLAVAEMLVSLGRIDEAVARLEEKLNYFDQNAGLRAGLAHLNMMQGNPREAASLFNQAALLDPEDMRLREELAIALVAARDDANATRVLRELLRDPQWEDRDDLRRLLAASLVRQDRNTDARQIYVELTRRNPHSAEDWIKLGELAWRAGDLGGTLQSANRVVTLAPDRHEGYLLAGMVWQRRGRLHDALRNFDRAADRAPDDATPLILRGIALQQAGRQAAAIDAYERALTREPEDRRAQRLLQALVVTP
jgi:tetratricopeptide (TPR) repeat protein